MFIWFSYQKINYTVLTKKGQVAPLLIAILAIVIMAIMVTVNLGKIGIYKTRTSNAADAAALAAASSMAASFDSLAIQSLMMYSIYLAYGDPDRGYAKRMYDIAVERYDEAIQYYEYARTILLAIAGLAYIPFGIGKWLYVIGGAAAIVCMAHADKNWITFYYNDVATLVGIMNACYEAQRDFYRQIWESTRGAVATARGAAYNLAFANFAIDKEGEPVEPGPSPPPWYDGQGREHWVRVDVGLDAPGSFSIYVTNEDIEYINRRYEHNMFWNWWAALISWGSVQIRLVYNVGKAKATPACTSWHTTPRLIYCIYPTTCIAASAAALHLAAWIIVTNETLASRVREILDEIWNAFQENGTMRFSSGDAGNEILVTLEEAWQDGGRYPRRLSISTSQFHQGEDLGLWRAEYGTIRSSARASFAGGDINGHHPRTDHNPELIE